jgi:hypothetical protein
MGFGEVSVFGFSRGRPHRCGEREAGESGALSQGGVKMLIVVIMHHVCAEHWD